MVIKLLLCRLIFLKDVMDKLQKSKPETMEQFKEAVGDIEGIKVEFKDKITIKF